MRFLSLFSGIEAASVAFQPLGWNPVAFAEIEPFPCKLLKHYYPYIPNLGDVTLIQESAINKLGKIDLVIAGFPCQDVSIAGPRKGLINADGTLTRSGLFYEAIRIVRQSRARFALFENVNGFYSSNDGADFASMVREILGLDFTIPSNGWKNSGIAVSQTGSLEWCTLDSKFFGVPQRRRRMYALADFGNWFDRPPILLQQESLSRTFKKSQTKGQEHSSFAGTLSANAGGLNRAAGNANELDFCIPVTSFKVRCGKDGGGKGYLGSENISFTLSTNQDQHLFVDSKVRRYTPLECERLQGFPDGYTNIPNASDLSRYKALGNSMTVPVINWIGSRIQTCLNLTEQS